MSEQLQHPTLDGRPVMIGDRLEVTQGTATVQFTVQAIGLRLSDPWLGWCVAGLDLDLEFRLKLCRRVEVAEQPPGDRPLIVETFTIKEHDGDMFALFYDWKVRNRDGATLIASGRYLNRVDRDTVVRMLFPDLQVDDHEIELRP